jgi:tRNA G37 N-methylase TrmD
MRFAKADESLHGAIRQFREDQKKQHETSRRVDLKKKARADINVLLPDAVGDDNPFRMDD